MLFRSTFGYSLYSSDLILNNEISNKTYLSFLLDDRFIIQKTVEPQRYQTKPYLSDIFYNLDRENNFSANVYFNIESFFKTKIYFNNLLNYPDFNTYFKNNYLVSIDPYLEKDANTLSLQYEYVKDSTLLNNVKQNDCLIINNNSIDINKFDNSNLKIEFQYNESSVDYIKNTIIPLIEQFENLETNRIDNKLIQLLIFYKLIEENYSSSEEVNNMLEIARINSNFFLTQENLSRIKLIASIAKQKYISFIRDTITKFLANTSFTISSQQIIDLKYTNARLDFIQLNSTNSSDRKSTRLNSSHTDISRMPSSA